MSIPTSTIELYLHSLKPSEQSYLDRAQAGTATWTPQSRPQWEALLSQADELFYGGAAGGGKTDLLIGLSVECHEHSVIFRRVYPNLKAVIQRSREIIGDSAKENKSDKIWTWPNGNTLEFGAMQYEDDKTQWQGRPHDLKAFDELPEFSRSQYTFACGWNRTTNPAQRCRVVCSGNPPTDEAGGWVIEYWGPWLDKNHPNPAKPGELRWYATVDGEEQEFMSGDSFENEGETIYPRSRTFIPAKVRDNPFYAHDARYLSVLQALPEPLRSMMLNGDFQAAAQMDPFQVIPTDWVRTAQRRWLERERPETPMTACGLDVARGGRDKTSLSRRHDAWFDDVLSWSGVVTSDGPAVAALVHQALGESKAPINIDVIGIGSSAYDSLKTMYTVNPINASSASEYRDRSGKLKMRNMRAEYYWRMRDSLDPVNGDEVALPPGNAIVADLCAARYKLTTSGIQIEAKDDIKARIGRSPDEGEAILLANLSVGPLVYWGF